MERDQNKTRFSWGWFFFFFFSFYLRKQIISYFYSLSIKTRPTVNNLQIYIY